jgi:hypothetical protein
LNPQTGGKKTADFDDEHDWVANHAAWIKFHKRVQHCAAVKFSLD